MFHKNCESQHYQFVWGTVITCLGSLLSKLGKVICCAVWNFVIKRMMKYFKVKMKANHNNKTKVQMKVIEMIKVMIKDSNSDAVKD